MAAPQEPVTTSGKKPLTKERKLWSLASGDESRLLLKYWHQRRYLTGQAIIGGYMHEWAPFPSEEDLYSHYRFVRHAIRTRLGKIVPVTNERITAAGNATMQGTGIVRFGDNVMNIIGAATPLISQLNQTGETEPQPPPLWQKPDWVPEPWQPVVDHREPIIEPPTTDKPPPTLEPTTADPMEEPPKIEPAEPYPEPYEPLPPAPVPDPPATIPSDVTPTWPYVPPPSEPVPDPPVPNPPPEVTPYLPYLPDVPPTEGATPKDESGNAMVYAAALAGALYLMS